MSDALPDVFPEVLSSAPVSLTRRSWVGIKALAASILLCGIRPATAARLTLNISLKMAAAVHLTFGLVTVVLLTALFAWMEGESLRTAWSLVVRDFAEDPKEFVLIIGGITLLIEAGFVGLAFVMMSWGAVDEPLRASFSHSLRRVWCQTPHAMFIILLVTLLAGSLDRLDDIWVSAHPVAYPPQPPNMIPNTTAWNTYFAEVGLIERKARAVKPWYLRYSEAMAVDFGFLCGIWFLAAMLRAVGVPRAGPHMPRQPRCDACGYDLTLMPMESRCPECGEPVTASLGPDARPGTPWELRRGHSMRAWWRTARLALFQPVVFGRMLRLSSPGTAHRRFLLLHMPLVFLIGAASALTLYYVVGIIEGKNILQEEIELVLVGAPVFGTLCMIGTLILSLASTGRYGVVFQIRDKRNLLTGAVQVVSYQVVYLIAWQIFGAMTAIGAVALGNSGWFKDLSISRRMGHEPLAFFLWFVPNLACGLAYWALVKRAVGATKYANK